MDPICTGLVAALAVSFYRGRTLDKVIDSLVPLAVGVVVAALARLATSMATSTASTSSTSSAVAVAEARHALVLKRMKQDQEALMEAVARLEGLAAGAENGGGGGEK